MPHHPSYHGKISGKEAEQRLTEHSEGNCYLTRFSENKKSYAVSAKISHNGMVQPVHLVLEIDSEDSSYSLEGSRKPFQTINKLLKYYEQNPFNEEIRSIGSICYPSKSPDPPPELQRQRKQTIPSPYQPDCPPLPEEPQNQNGVHQLMEMQKELIETHKKELKEQRELFKQQLSQLENQRRKDQRKEEERREEQRREDQRREEEREQRREEQRREDQRREEEREQRREEQRREEQRREEQRREEQRREEQRREEQRRRICSIQ